MDELLKHNPQIRFWVHVSDKLRFYHPFPTTHISQDLNIRANNLKGIRYRRLAQPDDSYFPVYAERVRRINPRSAKPDEFRMRIQKLIYPDHQFWPQKFLNSDELDVLLKHRMGHRLSYVVYVVNQFIEGLRVVCLLVDWQEQNFIDIGFKNSGLFSKCADGFGLIVPGMEDFQKLVPAFTEGFTIIEYLPEKRMCMYCGSMYNVQKGRPEFKKLKSNPMLLDRMS